MKRSFIRSLSVLCALSTPVIGNQVSVHSVDIQGSDIAYQSTQGVDIGDHVRVEGLLMPNGASVDLELDRVEVLTDDAQIVVGSVDGMQTLDRPEVIILSGIVAGDVDSMAYLAVSPYGTNGFVNLQGELISISTGTFAQGKDLKEALRVAEMDQLIDQENAPTLACGYSDGDVHLEPNGPMLEFGDAQSAASVHRGVETCRIAGIAVESDYEFTNDHFAGDVNASAAYLVSLVGAISEIFERDVNVRLAIPYLRVWADDSDPYSTSVDPLDQVRSVWSSSMNHVDRTLVHFFTSRTDPAYGGVAYVGVLCNYEYGYGVSAHLNGSFPYPLTDHRSGNWDVVVASHEIGHNFGTTHTHSYSPQIDGCGTGDCTDAFGGTIMSYCHGCPGGLTNIVLQFHPRVQNRIVSFMNSNSCDLMSVGITASDDFVETLEETPIDIDAIANDESVSCDAFGLVSVDSTTISGGSVELLDGAGPGGRDLFRYIPTPGYDGADSFEYVIGNVNGQQTGTVNIDVRAYRDADIRLSPIAGLRARYYELSNPTQLPDFEALAPIGEEVITDVAFASTEGEFMGSGLSEHVGVVLDGYIWAFVDGLYTFSTSSDDGSRLLIGDEVVVNNDGLHPMQRRQGTIPLRGGWHRVRIECFERDGGAGLFATIQGPSFGEVNLGGIMITHERSQMCSPADLNEDGSLDFFDVSVFMDAFQNQEAIADFTGDGNFDFFDVSAFRTLFLNGCP